MHFRLLVTCLFLLFINCLSSFAATPKIIQPLKKPKLVLMPIKVSEEDRNLAGTMETALVEGLQERYIVFSGERVQQKTREIFTKESKTAKAECDETKCMEDIAIAFQAELIAVANVTKRDGGYFLAISIQNIFDNKVVYTKSLAYKNSDAFEVIEKLKELAGTQPVVNNSPATVTEPIEETKLTKTNSNDAESALWIEVQATNTESDYNVYLDTYPKGKYIPLAKARIKKLKETANAVATLQEQQSWDTAQRENTENSYNLYLKNYPSGKYVALVTVKLDKIKSDLILKEQADVDEKQKRQLKAENAKGVWIDKETNLMWQDDEAAKTVKKKDSQGAVDYCENLILADYDDWKLPDENTLKGIFLKKDSLQSWDDNKLTCSPYWSTTSTVDNGSLLWMAGGLAGYALKKAVDPFVRCVRYNN